MTKEEKGLIEASRDGNLQKVKDLIKHGTDIHVNKEEAFYQAVSNGHLNVIKYLTSQGINIHVDGDYALCLAAGYDHLNVLKYLVDQGADASILNYESQRIAEERGYQDIVDFLIKEMSSNLQTQKDLKGLNTDGRNTCAKCGDKLNKPFGMGNTYNYCPICEK